EEPPRYRSRRPFLCLLSAAARLWMETLPGPCVRLVLRNPTEKVVNELPLSLDESEPILVFDQEQWLDGFRDNLDQGSDLLCHRAQSPRSSLEQGNRLGWGHGGQERQRCLELRVFLDGYLDQVAEPGPHPLLTGGRNLIDRPLRPAAVTHDLLHSDQALALEPLDDRIQRSVSDLDASLSVPHPESRRDLVGVHRPLA